MIYYLIISFLCCIAFLVIILYIRANRKIKGVIKEKEEIENLKREEIQRYFKEDWIKEKERLEFEKHIWEDDFTKYQNEIKNKYTLDASKYEGEIKQLDVQLKEKEARYNEVNQDLEIYRKSKIEEIDGAAAEYEKRQRLIVDAGIVQYREIRNKNFKDELNHLSEQKDEMLKDLDAIKSILEEERSKRAAINEEIKRAREVEEQQDFYRIQLNPLDKEDIDILRSVAPRLRHPEAVNKIIWTNYYQKPLAELRKRVGIEGSGIYKITRLKTNEVYIGKAVNVSTRWSDHCKAALGVGTLASSQLHRVMAEDGPEQFLFELLEEIPKDKLSERESYYIDFYDSKNYGLNTISGAK